MMWSTATPLPLAFSLPAFCVDSRATPDARKVATPDVDTSGGPGEVIITTFLTKVGASQCYTEQR